MSEDDFLKRWSRRKREAVEVAKPAPQVESPGRDTAPDQAAQGNTEKAEVEFDPASLPPIDSITAVSDITAFLRAGVPAELTRAALRRVWTADPAIRNFVGLAENAWDFTDPNAMPGFGPLESTEEVRRMIANLVDSIGRSAQPVISREDVQAAENLNDSSLIASTEEKQTQPSQVATISGQNLEHSAQNLGNAVLVQSSKEDIAMQRDEREAEAKSTELPRRPQGSALPR
jgi:hypothetical protein